MAVIYMVSVLGTIITEWDEGFKFWEQILSSSTGLLLIEKLVEIMDYYGFDGWLLNVENKLDPVKVPYMIKFVNALTKATKKHRKEVLIIWYDSVTVEGNLDWQDALTHLNRDFFDVLDGIFLNYTLKPETHFRN